MITELMQEFERDKFNKRMAEVISKEILNYAEKKKFKISYDCIYDNVITLMAVHNMTPKETYDQICEVCINNNVTYPWPEDRGLKAVANNC